MFNLRAEGFCNFSVHKAGNWAGYSTFCVTPLHPIVELVWETSVRAEGHEVESRYIYEYIYVYVYFPEIGSVVEVSSYLVHFFFFSSRAFIGSRACIGRLVCSSQRCTHIGLIREIRENHRVPKKIGFLGWLNPDIWENKGSKRFRKLLVYVVVVVHAVRLYERNVQHKTAATGNPKVTPQNSFFLSVSMALSERGQHHLLKSR